MGNNLKILDVRSDTASLPTPKMREAMYNVNVRDAILNEDPTVSKLEKMAASILGMESALLVVSGTMANQIAIMAMTERGNEVILGPESHLYNLEAAGMAVLSQVQVRIVDVENGAYDIDSLEDAIQKNGVQTAKTGLICLENTYNLNKGSVITLENMARIKDVANRHGIPVYLDGARIFNAATYLKVEPSDICQYVDAVQFCLTKGLGCPIGSILAGSKSFIENARRIRQRLGGGIRQAGIIAAPGIIALQNMTSHMEQDHQKATKLLNGLSKISGIKPISDQFQTNIVSIEIVKDDWDADRFIEELTKNNIFVKRIGKNKVRMVTHYSISNEDIDFIVNTIKTLLE